MSRYSKDAHADHTHTVLWHYYHILDTDVLKVWRGRIQRDAAWPGLCFWPFFSLTVPINLFFMHMNVIVGSVYSAGWNKYAMLAFSTSPGLCIAPSLSKNNICLLLQTNLSSLFPSSAQGRKKTSMLGQEGSKQCFSHQLCKNGSGLSSN